MIRTKENNGRQLGLRASPEECSVGRREHNKIRKAKKGQRNMLGK